LVVVEEVFLQRQDLQEVLGVVELIRVDLEEQELVDKET
jgi:hypothetical protein|tara:strand:- start:305 stop:421 length:117 start_codon:yes stop_codon:yes gene_type:complete